MAVRLIGPPLRRLPFTVYRLPSCNVFFFFSRCGSRAYVPEGIKQPLFLSAAVRPQTLSLLPARFLQVASALSARRSAARRGRASW